MVQSVLFFILGFLSAGLLALIVIPAVSRRSASMTRKRIEASVPLTLSEIQADKDRIRAESAMSVRRLEMSVKSLKETTAARAVEINRGREELKALAAELSEKGQALSELEAKKAELEAELGRREDQVQQLSGQLAEAERMLEERALELEKLGRMYDEAAFSSSNRQIELVAREAEIEKLAGDISTLREQRKEAVAEHKVAQEALKVEKKRAGDLDKKVARLLATVADRDEKLERRGRELARLRERLKGGTGAKNGLPQSGIQATDESGRPGGKDSAPVTPSVMAADADTEEVAGLNAERERLETRLTVLTRENRQLRADLSASQAGSADWSDERRESARLREQMHELAAEVVNLTAALDEPDSPIAKALATPPRQMPGGGERMPSLADRVRALQKAASAS